eukprot:TRINITY_DN59469_c0_g1_i1.p1 TRINITY_DN59469_c0_g1~~TRINITY_DN59469_c0_g1_i1.p1  ORF type:complete len:176 (+),score=10.75 TRINITY_DN59469_c0_g1_i1:346-873(+)
MIKYHSDTLWLPSELVELVLSWAGEVGLIYCGHPMVADAETGRLLCCTHAHELSEVETPQCKCRHFTCTKPMVSGLYGPHLHDNVFRAMQSEQPKPKPKDVVGKNMCPDCGLIFQEAVTAEDCTCTVFVYTDLYKYMCAGGEWAWSWQKQCVACGKVQSGSEFSNNWDNWLLAEF